jgi:hypothetical protein
MEVKENDRHMHHLSGCRESNLLGPQGGALPASKRFDDIRGEKGTAQQATDIPSGKPFVSSDRRQRSGATGFNLPVPASGTRDRVEERGMVRRDAGRVKGVGGRSRVPAADAVRIISADRDAPTCLPA